MRNALLGILFASLIGTGCYTGRTASAKKTNYVINGAALAIGMVILASAGNGGGSCSDDASCVGGAVGAEGGVAVGAILAAASLLGIGITAVVPTKVPDPADAAAR